MSGLHHVSTRSSPPQVRKSATKTSRSAPSTKINTQSRLAIKTAKVGKHRDEEEEIFDFEEYDDMATSFLQYWSVYTSPSEAAVYNLTSYEQRHVRKANPHTQQLHPLLLRELPPSRRLPHPHQRLRLSQPLQPTLSPLQNPPQLLTRPVSPPLPHHRHPKTPSPPPRDIGSRSHRMEALRPIPQTQRKRKESPRLGWKPYRRIQLPQHLPPLHRQRGPQTPRPCRQRWEERARHAEPEPHAHHVQRQQL